MVISPALVMIRASSRREFRLSGNKKTMPALLSPEIRDAQKSPLGFWSNPAVIQENDFVHKSLSNWSFNIAIGCGHACRFCYVPSAATIKMGAKLKEYGVEDPDAEWGD